MGRHRGHLVRWLLAFCWIIAFSTRSINLFEVLSFYTKFDFLSGDTVDFLLRGSFFMSAFTAAIIFSNLTGLWVFLEFWSKNVAFRADSSMKVEICRPDQQQPFLRLMICPKRWCSLSIFLTQNHYLIICRAFWHSVFPIKTSNLLFSFQTMEKYCIYFLSSWQKMSDLLKKSGYYDGEHH